MNIVFTVNPTGLEGLGATLNSLVRNCSNSEELKLWFLCSDFRRIDRHNIERLLKNEQYKGTVEYINFDASLIFGHLKSLHGDWTTYGRLLIVNYIKSDYALYLDADIIVQLDILSIKSHDLNNNILAAVYGSSANYALERDFFINYLHCNPEQACFNAGVLLFNLKEWREREIEAELMNLGRKYHDKLLSADQTLLNAFCMGKFSYLPSNFNNEWSAGKEEPRNAHSSIIHFVGSPKPWDFFGRFVHKGHSLWNSYNTDFWRKEYGNLSIDKLRRTWNIRRSLIKHIKKALASNRSN